MAIHPFALTSDDAGSGDPALFEELLEFLRDRGMVATLFVVPLSRGIPLDQKPEWADLLHRAMGEGHELQLHALDHGSPFEFGVPPPFMLDIIPAAKARWEKEREAIEAGHTLTHMRERLARGMEIFERALGMRPQGFRGPCLSMCEATYQAMAELGFRWSSNLVVNPMGWRYINRDYDAGESWQAGIPSHPFRHLHGITEVPMLSEYTWYLKEEDVDRHYALMKSDYDRVREAGDPFVSLSHFYAMTGEWTAGQRVYDRLIEYAAHKSDLRFATVSDLVEQARITGSE